MHLAKESIHSLINIVFQCDQKSLRLALINFGVSNNTRCLQMSNTYLKDIYNQLLWFIWFFPNGFFFLHHRNYPLFHDDDDSDDNNDNDDHNDDDDNDYWLMPYCLIDDYYCDLSPGLPWWTTCLQHTATVNDPTIRLNIHSEAENVFKFVLYEIWCVCIC